MTARLLTTHRPDRLVACWNACEGMGDPVVEIESLRLTDRKANSTRCNSGHDSLPVLLWDCPVCVEHKRNELLDALVMAHTRLTECGDAGVESPLTLTEIEALLRKHGRQV